MSEMQQSETDDRHTVLVVDDERSMRELLQTILEVEGYRVLCAESGEDAVKVFTSDESIDLVIQDLKMPGMDGRQLLRWFQSRDVGVPIVVITAFSTWDDAVEAMRLGAYDYIKKPFDTDTIRSVVARAVERYEFMRSCSDSERESANGWVELIGNNAPIQEVLRLVKRIARTDSTVLVQGESGTGKELVARAIHYRSHRRSQPFVPVNCSAFTESLLESELFGHVRGAFTGAVADKDGLFRTANGGTLFLDEVADMSLTTQVKILRVLEDRRITPVGDAQQTPIDVRIIAATNKDVEGEVEAGRFREDLFYRLNVIPIDIPALRERREDIPLLVGHFLAKYSKRLGKEVESISDRALRFLNEYSWPGNVRELENVIQRHVALCDGNAIDSISMGGRHRNKRAAECSNGGQNVLIPPDGVDLEEILEKLERRFLREALKITDGNLTNAAKLLGMSYRSMRYRVKKLQVRDKNSTTL